MAARGSAFDVDCSVSGVRWRRSRGIVLSFGA
jgi:hypothetical protein